MQKGDGTGPDGLIDMRDTIENIGPFKRLVQSIPHTPNQITAARLPIAGIQIASHAAGGPIISTSILAFNAVLDWLDGFKARVSEQSTEEGKAMDPLFDKIIIHLNFLYAAVFITEDIASRALITIGAAGDAYSQLKRKNQFPDGLWNAIKNINNCRPSEEDSGSGANVYGKLKLILQTLTAAGLLTREQLIDLMQSTQSPEDLYNWIIRVGLIGSVGLTTMSVLKKRS